jgi:hypothetical protein
MMLKKRIIWLVCTLLSIMSFQLEAQVHRATVSDAEGNPLEGAQIANTRGILWAITDAKGHTSWKAAVPDTLTIRLLGYREHKQIISGREEKLVIQLEIEPFSLQQITIQHQVKSNKILADIDLRTRPVSSSQEILRTVPGLFIGQHAGGGKAEQMFLRGFDIDHGTDVAVSVEGLPVNMVSHAHGQGYADLHFVIPETVESIDFGKGPYYADQGNLATAAYVQFRLLDKPSSSFAKMEIGQFNSFRGAGLLRLFEGQQSNAYLAGEYNTSDGWFDSPQDFHRTNLLGRWKFRSRLHTIRLTGSHFQSAWNASGQIPERAVRSGLIGRFGAIDNTEGGATDRQNLMLTIESTLGRNWKLAQTAYLSRYAFDLFSNFTFFLNDPVNGDQIRQKENRWLGGYQASWSHTKYTDSYQFTFKGGIGIRRDQVNENQLAHTINRNQDVEIFRHGDIRETNLSSWAAYEIDLGSWLLNPSIRYDRFFFNYRDLLEMTDRSRQAGRWSPKLNLIYQPSDKIQYFLKSGLGFHSNDTRVVLEKEADRILPAAAGADLGFIWKPSDKWILNSALWYLDLQQEFVYVGDEGIIEPSGKTRRLGWDAGLRFQPSSWLFFNLDLNYSNARNRNYEENAKYIPLAPVWSSLGAATLVWKGFNFSSSFRYLSDRPATEDGALTAEGYLIQDLAASHRWKKWELNCRIENLWNVDWNETQFATLSRLRGEINPVEEIHFTPGTPFFIKTGITFHF